MTEILSGRQRHDVLCVCVKEEELRKEGGKYAHLNEELHVSIEAFAHPVDCYGRLSHALYELRRHLVPVCISYSSITCFYLSFYILSYY